MATGVVEHTLAKDGRVEIEVHAEHAEQREHRDGVGGGNEAAKHHRLHERDVLGDEAGDDATVDHAANDKGGEDGAGEGEQQNRADVVEEGALLGVEAAAEDDRRQEEEKEGLAVKDDDALELLDVAEEANAGADDEAEHDGGAGLVEVAKLGGAEHKGGDERHDEHDEHDEK